MQVGRGSPPAVSGQWPDSEPVFWVSFSDIDTMAIFSIIIILFVFMSIAFLFLSFLSSTKNDQAIMYSE